MSPPYWLLSTIITNTNSRYLTTKKKKNKNEDSRQLMKNYYWNYCVIVSTIKQDKNCRSPYLEDIRKRKIAIKSRITAPSFNLKSISMFSMFKIYTGSIAQRLCGAPDQWPKINYLSREVGKRNIDYEFVYCNFMYNLVEQWRPTSIILSYFA